MNRKEVKMDVYQAPKCVRPRDWKMNRHPLVPAAQCGAREMHRACGSSGRAPEMKAGV